MMADFAIDVLREGLRQHEQRNQYVQAIGYLEALLEHEDWDHVLITCSRWLAMAMEGTCRRTLNLSEGPGPFGLRVLRRMRYVSPGSPQMARHAANSLRLVAPYTGVHMTDYCPKTKNPRCHRLDPKCPDQSCLCLIPSPLSNYVLALRIWWPGGWYQWLQSKMGNALRWEPEVPFWENAVWRSGDVQCGLTCPELPEVPELVV